MYNNFLCYTRNDVITHNTLQYIKSTSNDLYCDYFDNIFCKIENNIRYFSNKGIGFCLNNLINSSSIYYINTKQRSTLFTQLELLIANYLNKNIYLLNYTNNSKIEISICKDINLYLENILNNNNIVNSMFFAYNRNTNDYKTLLKRFKKVCGKNIYIDCLDNVNLRNVNNRMNYTALNKNCTYSTSIFDEVFNKLIISNSFCFIESHNIYNNHFVRLQYMIAKILNKDIYCIKEDDFYSIINNKLSFKNALKKADLPYCNEKFLLKTNNIPLTKKLNLLKVNN